jgi:hypothetical protein
MTKIYLAKSNLASVNDLIFVNSILKKDPNIEVLEWNNPQADKEKLQSAEILVILPPEGTSSKTDSGMAVNIGRGLADQFVAYHNVDDPKDKAFIFLEQKFYRVIDFTPVPEKQRDWKKNYSTIITNGIPLETCL